MRVGARLQWDKVKRTLHLLGPEDEPTPGSRPRTTPPLSAEELVRIINQEYERGTVALDLVTSNAHLSVLGWSVSGWTGGVRDWARGSQMTMLRKSLQFLLGSDDSFQWQAPDETFERIDRLVSRDFCFVLTGHTHRERCLEGADGKGRYLNTGTWAGLMRMEPETLESDATFTALFEAIQSGKSFQALEAQGVRVLHRPAVAWVRKTSTVETGKRRRGNCPLSMLSTCCD